MLQKSRSPCKRRRRKIHCHRPKIERCVMNKLFLVLACASALLVDSPDVCHAVKVSQSAHDVEVAIKSLSLAAKRYDAMEVADVFGDIYWRANEKLDENGFYGISLCLTDTDTDIDTSSMTIDVPELTIFQAFEFVARRFGWTVEYKGGGVFVRGRHSEHLPGDAGGRETVE